MTTKPAPIITICSSVAFYRQAIEVQAALERLGYAVVIPSTANLMEQSGDFEVSHHKTWFADANDYHKKAQLMREHFDKVAEGDAVLVLNYEKRGLPNYIGGNVLMEMSLGFYLHKPIFVMNEIPEESAYLEELVGMGSVALHGKIEDLPGFYDEAVAAAKAL